MIDPLGHARTRHRLRPVCLHGLSRSQLGWRAPGPCRSGSGAKHDEVPVRVHEPLSVMDLLDTAGSSHSWPLPAALAALQRHGRGVAVLLNAGADAQALIGRIVPAAVAPRAAAAGNMDLRTYGVGAQILRHLGVRRMKLLGAPRRMPSMTGYGLEVTGFVAPNEMMR